MEISSELEQHIQKHDENRNYSKFTPDKRLEGDKEREFFISKFPRSKIRNIKMLDYVQGKRVNGNSDPEAFSTLTEFGSTNFGKIGGGSAKKHGIYMRVGEQKLDYNPKFASPDAAYDSIINLIADCVDHAENFIKTKDWKKFSDIITQTVESQTGTPSIPVISKIIALYYPDEFLRIWSHGWLNKILDLFQVNRDDLPETGKEGRFYEKMQRVVEAKNSHPIMKEWSNKYFSYIIGEYLVQKKSEKSESPLLKFLKYELKKNMKANYQPIVIKTLLEKGSPFTVSIKEIRKKFDELNFGRMSYTKASGRPGGNDAISSVAGALKKFVKFPEGTSQDNAILNDGVVKSAEIPECLKICGQEIARWHIENIVQDGYEVWDILPGKEEDKWKYLDDFLKLNCIGAGWNQIKDLEKLPTKADALKYIREHHPEVVKTQSATAISHDIKQKDIVVLSKGQSEIIDFGIVTGVYNYNADAEPHEECAHTRGVVWLRRGNIKKEDLPEGLMVGVISAVNHILEKKQEMMNILLEKTTSNSGSYFIITQNPDSKYDDIEGEQYQYDNHKPNFRRFVKGSNFIVQSKVNEVNQFVGYGKVGTIVQSKDTTKEGKSITKFVAKYSDYTPFEEPKIRTDEIHQKMKDQKSYGGRAPAILPIDQSLYAEIIGEDLIDNDQLTDTLDSTNLDECKEFESKGYLEILKRKRNLIFYGPPGTGKTFTAEGLARCLDKQNYDEQDNRRHTWKTVSALVLLENEGKALNYHEIEKRAIVKDLVSTIGKTKHETIAKEIRNDIETNGEDSIFTHPSQGMYGLNVPTTFAKAAEMILLAENEPLHSDKITEIALHNKIIKQNEEPGITPTRSMNQILSQDVTNNDKNSTFISTGPATYTLRKKNPVSRQPNEKYYELVTFHPSYSYEDFVEGFRPTGGNIAALLANQMYDEIKLPEELTEDQKNEIQKLINIYKREWRKQASRGQPQFNNLSHYVLEPGIFKKMCSNAKNHGDKKYILIIDEINRGNISKILGELITLIERSYRGPKFTLKLAYSKEDFYIPDNIYIIGTMNTADTSLIQVDAALRRRFAWKELMPDEEIEFVDEKFKIVMKKINEKIKIKKLRDKQIGHTYFMHLKDDNDFKFTFLTEIIPLLQDYFFHDYAELEEVLGKGVIDVEKLDVKKELLDLEGEEFFEKVKTSLETSS